MMNYQVPSSVLLFLFFIGILIAVLGAGFDSSLTLPYNKTISEQKNNILVTVNGQAITQEKFNTARTKIKNLPVDKLLALIVDEYLLLQRAEELGLLHADRVVRKAIVHRVIEQEISKVLNQEYDEENLLADYKSYYLENLPMFTSEDLFQVQIAKFDGDDSCSQAIAFKSLWNKNKLLIERLPVDNPTNNLLARKQWENNLINQPLSYALHSKALIYRQLGNDLAAKVFELSKGQLSAPIRFQQSCLLVYLQNKKLGQAHDFDEVKEQVVSAYNVTLRKKTLSNLLLSLRSKADIQIAKDIIKVIGQ